MARVKRIMETDESGVKRQSMSITHVSAVLGLEKMISGQSKVLSINGRYDAAVSMKADSGLGNAVTRLPYVSETSDGTLTAEILQKTVNGEGGAYIPPTAIPERLGGIKVGELLEVTEEGISSVTKQTDFNFSEELKGRLESLRILKAGTNISIVGDGTISSAGGSGTSGVNQSYIDQKFQEVVNQAEKYTNERAPNFIFEEIGEVQKITDIVEIKQSGAQVYPQTHRNVIKGKPTTVKGGKGDPGQAVTITIGTVSSGSTAPAMNVGTSSAARFNFILLRGNKGDPGINATTTAVATTTANGLMSPVDKAKSDGVATGTQKNPDNATTMTAGLMSATDKVKLDGLVNITFEEVGTV